MIDTNILINLLTLFVSLASAYMVYLAFSLQATTYVDNNTKLRMSFLPKIIVKCGPYSGGENFENTEVPIYFILEENDASSISYDFNGINLYNLEEVAPGELQDRILLEKDKFTMNIKYDSRKRNLTLLSNQSTFLIIKLNYSDKINNRYQQIFKIDPYTGEIRYYIPKFMNFKSQSIDL